MHQIFCTDQMPTSESADSAVCTENPRSTPSFRSSLPPSASPLPPGINLTEQYIDWSQPILHGYEPPPSGPSSTSRKAWHWEHGFEVFSKAEKKKGWACRYCYAANDLNRRRKWIYLDNTGFSGIHNHLQSRHKIDANGKIKPRGGIMEAFRKSATRSPKDSEVYHRLASTFNKERFKNLQLRWIIRADLPFNAVDNQFYREHMLAVNDSLVDQQMLPTDTTIKARIMERFKRFKSDVKLKIALAQTPIHLSFDMWTSRNQLCLCGIVVHFLDANDKPASFLLSLPEVLGKHSGANIASTVIAIIEEFGFANNVGYFITDNASNNDTAIADLAMEMDMEPEKNRLRCMGHVLNLTARAILFGNDVDALQESLENPLSAMDEVGIWRKKGPIGELHNVVRYICASSQRIQRFKEVQKRPEVENNVQAHLDGTSSATSWNLEHDNETRWNSTYKMVTRALELRQAIQIFLQDIQADHAVDVARKKAVQRDRPAILDDALDDDDWDTITYYKEVLHPISHATKKLEGDGKSGRNGVIWEVYPVFEFLIKHYYEMEEQFKHGNQTQKNFCASINLGIEKLDEYYRKMDDTPAYAAAVVLQPQFKWAWFQGAWGKKPNGPEWLQHAQALVQELWDEYKDTPIANDPWKDGPPSKRTKANDNDFIDDLNQQCIQNVSSSASAAGSASQPPTEDEYNWYCGQPLVPRSKDFNPIKWWLGMATQLPRLSAMAVAILTIPAMSAKAERIFSHCGNIVRPNRARLAPDSLAAVMCLKQWDMEEVIDWDTASEGGSRTDSASHMDLVSD